jgi:hypothetical protein
MRMNINIDRKIKVFFSINYSIFDSQNRRLLLLSWCRVIAVQVLAVSVQTVVASVNTVWVQHRNYFEHKVVEQNLLLRLDLFLS